MPQSPRIRDHSIAGPLPLPKRLCSAATEDISGMDDQQSKAMHHFATSVYETIRRVARINVVARKLKVHQPPSAGMISQLVQSPPFCEAQVSRRACALLQAFI